jgi:hypothetical protein
MAEQAGHGKGQGGVPRRDPSLPDAVLNAPGRDSHLVGFAKGGEWDACPPFPPCSRHARESDFEHAIPYDKGGRTCACNAGARSRGCHQVKQSPGWNVTQPRPGWHQWVTPSGRTYIQGPMRYPV